MSEYIENLEEEKKELLKIKDMAENIVIDTGEMVRKIDQKVYEIQKED